MPYVTRYCCNLAVANAERRKNHHQKEKIEASVHTARVLPSIVFPRGNPEFSTTAQIRTTRTKQGDKAALASVRLLCQLSRLALPTHHPFFSFSTCLDSVVGHHQRRKMQIFPSNCKKKLTCTTTKHVPRTGLSFGEGSQASTWTYLCVSSPPFSLTVCTLFAIYRGNWVASLAPFASDEFTSDFRRS